MCIISGRTQDIFFVQYLRIVTLGDKTVTHKLSSFAKLVARLIFHLMFTTVKFMN